MPSVAARLLAWVVVLPLCSEASASEVPRNKVKLRIVDERGKPIPGATVRGDRGKPRTTDENGEVFIDLTSTRQKLFVAPPDRPDGQRPDYMEEEFEIPNRVVEIKLSLRAAGISPLPEGVTQMPISPCVHVPRRDACCDCVCVPNGEFLCSRCVRPLCVCDVTPAFVQNACRTEDPLGSDAILGVSVPHDALVFINGKPTTSVGARRGYISSELKPGYTYKYVVRVQIEREGRTLEDTREVVLRAGDNVTVVFDSFR